ncbi:hypothetical protein GJ496_008304 [Pomphorhynchus laevis]|nr:hypothetical protein GJ496_008304 [Pomphorhynchus laevis]
MECIVDTLLGTILIQTSRTTGEPELYYLRLPDNIHNCRVFVLDATVATGAAAIMAIRVLLDHGVPQENISVISLLMSSFGYQSVAYVYPDVTIITSSVDSELSENFHILPGLGNFGDRYYGTE